VRRPSRQARLDKNLHEIDAKRLKQRGATQHWHFTKGGVDWLEAKSREAAAQTTAADDENTDDTPDSRRTSTLNTFDNSDGPLGEGTSDARPPPTDGNSTVNVHRLAFASTAAQAAMAAQMPEADDALKAASEVKALRHQMADELLAASAVVDVIEGSRRASDRPKGLSHRAAAHVPCSILRSSSAARHLRVGRRARTQPARAHRRPHLELPGPRRGGEGARTAHDAARLASEPAQFGRGRA
jgi:hypothetical protein